MSSTVIELLLSPINPADINVIQGVYPSPLIPVSLPTLSPQASPAGSVFIGGNEGLAEVTHLGEGVTDLQERDWVVLAKPQRGAWSSNMNIPIADLLRISKADLRFNEVIGATITVSSVACFALFRLNYKR